MFYLVLHGVYGRVNTTLNYIFITDIIKFIISIEVGKKG